MGKKAPKAGKKQTQSCVVQAEDIKIRREQGNEQICRLEQHYLKLEELMKSLKDSQSTTFKNITKRESFGKGIYGISDENIFEVSLSNNAQPHRETDQTPQLQSDRGS